jgi:hypothetical protein
MEAFARQGLLNNTNAVAEALKRSPLAATQALLLPFAPAAELSIPSIPMEPVVSKRLRTVEPGSPLHFALVEIVRRQHRQVCQAADRYDKERRSSP